MDEQQTNAAPADDAGPLGMECQVCDAQVRGIHAAKDMWLPLAGPEHAPACPFYVPVAQVEPDDTEDDELSALDSAREAIAQSIGCVRIAMGQTTDEAVLKHLRGLADALNYARVNIAHHSVRAAQAKTNAQVLIGCTAAFLGGALAGHGLTLPKEPGRAGRGVSSIFDSLSPEMKASGANLLGQLTGLLQAWLATHTTKPSDPAGGVGAPPSAADPGPVVTPPPTATS
jgi:hypothetical protein